MTIHSVSFLKNEYCEYTLGLIVTPSSVRGREDRIRVSGVWRARPSLRKEEGGHIRQEERAHTRHAESQSNLMQLVVTARSRIV